MPVFLVMPQWQGSPSARAMQLVDGADVLREDLPSSARHEVQVPLEAGDSLGTPVSRLSSLLRARDAALELLAELPEPAITLGGDGSTALAGLAAAVQRHGTESLAVLWFDANSALQHPSTSPSGAAAGMTLQHVLGEGVEDLAFPEPLPASRVALVGTRSVDEEENGDLERLELSQLTAETVTDWLKASGASHVYIHIDLDVLDPAEFRSVHSSVPFGLSIAELTGAVRAAVASLPLVGATISEFAPSDDAAARDDLPTVLRLLGALTSGQTR